MSGDREYFDDIRRRVKLRGGHLRSFGGAWDMFPKYCLKRDPDKVYFVADEKNYDAMDWGMDLDRFATYMRWNLWRLHDCEKNEDAGYTILHFHFRGGAKVTYRLNEGNLLTIDAKTGAIQLVKRSDFEELYMSYKP